MEALTLVDIFNKHIISSVEKTRVGDLAGLKAAVGTINAVLAEIHAANSSYDKEKLTRVLRLGTMIDIRAIVNRRDTFLPI